MYILLQLYTSLLRNLCLIKIIFKFMKNSEPYYNYIEAYEEFYVL